MSSRLYNCCTDSSPPDWTQFNWLEVCGCISLKDPDGNDTGDVEGGASDAEAEFWTVYAHLKDGGVEAITDCKTRKDADGVAKELSDISGLAIND